MTRTDTTLKEFRRVPDKSGCGPFWVNDDVLVNVIGKLQQKDTVSKGSKTKPKTTTHRNVPLGIEEWNMALMLCMIFPTVYRMHYSITYEDWKKSESRETCLKELKFILRTQVFTTEADTWGKSLNKPEKEYEDMKWAATEQIVKPERIYWAAAMMLAGMMMSMMYVRVDVPAVDPEQLAVQSQKAKANYEKAVKTIKEVKTQNLKKMKGLINALESYQNDIGGVSQSEGGRHMVYILGTYIQRILYDISPKTACTHNLYIIYRQYVDKDAKLCTT